MSAPLYFLPGVYRQHLVQGSRLVAAVLEARGLQAIFGDVTDVLRELSLSEITASGPGGQSGTMLVPLAPGREPPVRLGYKPDFQTWHDEGDFWIGFDNESPPAPAELARKKQITGYRMQLGDGQEWVIPILRRPDDSSELPSAFTLAAAGGVSQAVRPQYRALWEASAEICQWFVEGTLIDAARLRLHELIEWCVRILSVNYRFDRVLQNHLGVIGNEEWASILCYAIDWPTVQAIDSQKKTPPLTTPDMPTSTSPGSAVVSEDIDPAAG